MAEKRKNKFKSFERKNPNLPVFEKLCDRAKNIIFNSLSNPKTMQYFLVLDLPDELLQMSPIEQIFYVCADIFTILVENSIDIEEQKYIVANGKKYRADFYAERFLIGNQEYYLNNPIVIELDGHDYHSSKDQRNYDYERENNLKLEGYHVIRFTGSQVFKNPFDCVEKVYQYAARLIKNKEYN
jgi:very-short-patch-repair endonuclease